MNLSHLSGTDPELVEWFGAFDEEVIASSTIDRRRRHLVRLGAAIACQSEAGVRLVLTEALEDQVAPVLLREVAYQALPYVGLAKVLRPLAVVNEVLGNHGVSLPLAAQGTTTPEDRFEKGLATRQEIFGGAIEQQRASAPADTRHIQDLLSSNCFGDHYTRGALSLAERELLTFAILVAHGGCDAQAVAHARGNVDVGNDRGLLLGAVTAMLPLIGYPRTLNGVAAIDAASPPELS